MNERCIRQQEFKKVFEEHYNPSGEAPDIVFMGIKYVPTIKNTKQYKEIVYKPLEDIDVSYHVYLEK